MSSDWTNRLRKRKSAESQLFQSPSGCFSAVNAIRNANIKNAAHEEDIFVEMIFKGPHADLEQVVNDMQTLETCLSFPRLENPTWDTLEQLTSGVFVIEYEVRQSRKCITWDAETGFVIDTNTRCPMPLRISDQSTKTKLEFGGKIFQVRQVVKQSAEPPAVLPVPILKLPLFVNKCGCGNGIEIKSGCRICSFSVCIDHQAWCGSCNRMMCHSHLYDCEGSCREKMCPQCDSGSSAMCCESQIPRLCRHCLNTYVAPKQFRYEHERVIFNANPEDVAITTELGGFKITRVRGSVVCIE